MKPVKILHPIAADAGGTSIKPKSPKKSYDPRAMSDTVTVNKR